MVGIVLIYGFVVSIPMFFTFYRGSYVTEYDNPSTFYIKIEDSMFSNVKIEMYFHFSRFFLNDFIILIINLAVDCCLVSVVRANLTKKVKNVFKFKDTSHFELSALEKKKFAEENKKKTLVERKTNAMVIISIVIYVFCRVPELLSVFFFFYAVRVLNSSCSQIIFCHLISNFVEYMYMLSYIFNIFLYSKFNNFFRRGFGNFFNTKLRQSE